MEVAGQWRREWAGTAEYGKVIEGGVTRRVARAMEVLNASAPGASVRVMRAAYHSSSGPGAPTASYLMHSSRQVLSSGYNFLEPPSLPTKPLEISSTPLYSSPDSETENYKVTEPDDFEISEPSKWRRSTGASSIRMPSEESSSADTASIIDLDSSDEWNNRRKSYSFEDTSPMKKINDVINFSIDSSTDSGICKSTELFNDSNNSTILKSNEHFEHTSEIKQDFKNWLTKNRRNTYKEIKMSPPKSVHIDRDDSNITLGSTGKVTITLPVDVTYSEQYENQSKSSDENDRKTKKVEFCKTELHFTADTGDNDENTAATKGILKNKIPKPKPYLLGENMAFGTSNNQKTDDFEKSGTVLSAVSLINRQLQAERRYSNDTTSSVASDLDLSPHINKPYRTPTKDPQLRGSSNQKFSTRSLESSIQYDSKISSKPSSISPTPSRSQIRELRGSELAYFGISKDQNNTFDHNQDNLQEEILHSVKLVQKITNSVCNSEAESDDGHDYQNVSTSYDLKKQPIPTPKPRTKYSDVNGKITENRVLRSITEQEIDLEVSSKINKNNLNNPKESIHPPRDKNRNTVNKENIVMQKSTRKTTSENSSFLKKDNHSLKRDKETNNNINKYGHLKLERKTSRKETKKPESPIYVNVDTKKHPPERVRKPSQDLNAKQKIKSEKRESANSRKDEKERIYSIKPTEPVDKNKENHYKENKEKYEGKRDQQTPLLKKRAQKRTEKLCTPENPPKDSVRQSLSTEKKASPRIDDLNYKSTNNGSLNKNYIRSTTNNSAENGSLSRNEKKLKNDYSKSDTIKIPKITTVHKQILSDNTSSSKKTSKSHRDTLNSQQSLQSNQNKSSNVKIDKSIKPHRSKYVINYDDKNGTVSSVCKIKTGPGTYKRKIIPIESKDHEPTKGLNRIALRK
ncbi:unnamed protein product [Danaus chrysippus]|uniref:(African queen) hypothetical protein n=1 Tax=Danaus chrysippus TaxID=151541 RepID=A0A8J2R8T8_9NEOP|nr:unnamed protein product [Danaus chrysippus]